MVLVCEFPVKCNKYTHAIIQFEIYNMETQTIIFSFGTGPTFIRYHTYINYKIRIIESNARPCQMGLMRKLTFEEKICLLNCT